MKKNTKKKPRKPKVKKRVPKQVALPRKEQKFTFLVSVPFTGLGLYGGFRGNRWLRNRIEVFKTFVIPSLLNQSDRNFIVWVQWRPEERTNPQVVALKAYMDAIPNLTTVFTYTGIPFYDDKYQEEEAIERLSWTLQKGLPELFSYVPDGHDVIWLLQPSDDCYHKDTVGTIRNLLTAMPDVQVATFDKGYICNYRTMELLEYNPKTNPPFFAIKYPRATFFEVRDHMAYTGPFKSHEFIGNKLTVAHFNERGFLVGTHLENISTHFNHPYGGEKVPKEVLENFGLLNAGPVKFRFSLRKAFMRHLPHPIRRKIRYWFGEVIGNRLYNWLRS